MKGLFGTVSTIAAVAFALPWVATQQASADAVIFNTGAAATATVALGVNDEGHLNVTDPTGAFSTTNGGFDTETGLTGSVGLAARFPDGSFRDATSPGCLCEGWGVSGTHVATATAYSGYANKDTDLGAHNLTAAPLATDAAAGTGSYVTSSVTLTSLPGLAVTQAYASATVRPDVFFEDKVTIANTTGSAIDDLRYVRVMDWDIPPSEFFEFVSIQGTAGAAALEKSHDNGFNTANPLADFGPLNPATVDTDFVDVGPADHGAYFRFNFGSLADGDTREFSIFYGAVAGEGAALTALAAEGITLYSLGQWSGDPTGGTPITYIFGFKGAGITAAVPEPSTVLLLGMGLAALGLWGRRRALA